MTYAPLHRKKKPRKSTKVGPPGTKGAYRCEMCSPYKSRQPIFNTKKELRDHQAENHGMCMDDFIGGAK